jgi:hypothetical protein
VAVSSAAVPAGVNILLRVLSCEVNVVAHLALILACHACVAIGDVKTARVACVPICIAFDEIGVLGPLLRLHAAVRGISWYASLRGISIHVDSTACGGGHRICRGKHTAHSPGRGETAGGILLLRASASAASASTSAASISVLVGCRHHRSLYICGGWGSTASPVSTAANALSGIAGVERQRRQLLQDLVLIGM